MNADKCHLLVCNYGKDVSLIVESEVIDCSNSVKCLGITIDKKLNFNEHVTKICKTVSAEGALIKYRSTRAGVFLNGP